MIVVPPPEPPPDWASTLIEYAGSEALKPPALTLITMFAVTLALLLDGAMPESSPVLLSKLAQAGAFAMLKVSAAPFGSPAVGVKE